MKKKKTPKRLDGKKILVSLTAEIEADMKIYCMEKGIESENELVRQAIVHYVARDYSDSTLSLSSLKEIKQKLSRLEDMITVLFSHQKFSHLNILGYHAEIADEFKEAALTSAEVRHEKFLAYFRKKLRDDPPFFERLLHGYVSEQAEGP